MAGGPDWAQRPGAFSISIYCPCFGGPVRLPSRRAFCFWPMAHVLADGAPGLSVRVPQHIAVRAIADRLVVGWRTVPNGAGHTRLYGSCLEKFRRTARDDDEERGDHSKEHRGCHGQAKRPAADSHVWKTPEPAGCFARPDATKRSCSGGILRCTRGPRFARNQGWALHRMCGFAE